MLFDGNTAQANLNAIESIISEKLFKTLPGPEHPSGTPTTTKSCLGDYTVAAAETELMRKNMNSYGKAWHG